MTAIVHQGSGSLHIVHSNATEYARTDVTALATLLTMAWVSVTMGAGGAAWGAEGVGGAGEAVFGGGGGGEAIGAMPGKLLKTPGNCAKMSLMLLCCSWRRSGRIPGCAPSAASVT